MDSCLCADTVLLSPSALVDLGPPPFNPQWADVPLVCATDSAATNSSAPIQDTQLLSSVPGLLLVTLVPVVIVSLVLCTCLLSFYWLERRRSRAGFARTARAPTGYCDKFGDTVDHRTTYHHHHHNHHHNQAPSNHQNNSSSSNGTRQHQHTVYSLTKPQQDYGTTLADRINAADCNLIPLQHSSGHKDCDTGNIYEEISYPGGLDPYGPMVCPSLGPSRYHQPVLVPAPLTPHFRVAPSGGVVSSHGAGRQHHLYEPLSSGSPSPLLHTHTQTQRHRHIDT